VIPPFILTVPLSDGVFAPSGQQRHVLVLVVYRWFTSENQPLP
jgi:hypothetical protein